MECQSTICLYRVCCFTRWIGCNDMCMFPWSASTSIKKVRLSAGCQEVSRCCTRDKSEESIACKKQKMQARHPPWLWNPEQTLVSVALRKWLVSSKNFIKKINIASWSSVAVETHDDWVLRSNSKQFVNFEYFLLSEEVNKIQIGTLLINFLYQK